MTKHRFSYDDQLFFAKFTGDYNPVHLDKVFARRLLFGRVVIHGIHLLLWGLDVWLAKQTRALYIAALEARFLRAVGIDEECACAWNVRQHQIEIIVMAGDAIAMRVKLKAVPAFKDNVSVSNSFPKREKCANHTTEDASKVFGKVKLFLDRNLINERFPNVARILPSSQVAEILATTRIVGMK